MNRIATAIAHQQRNIESRLDSGLTTKAFLDDLSKQLDMSADEYVRFQELKTLAVAEETLTLEEGLEIYGHLGNSPVRFNRQPVAVKAVLTKLFEELLRHSMNQRSRALS